MSCTAADGGTGSLQAMHRNASGESCDLALVHIGAGWHGEEASRLSGRQEP